MTKVIVWNGETSADIVGFTIGPIRRSLVGESRHNFVPVPGREGSWHFPEKRGRRTIEAECHVLGDTFAERRDFVTAVAGWYDVEVQASLTMSEDPGVYYEAVAASTPNVEEWRQLGTFTLTWLVQPYALDNDVDSDSWTADADEIRSWDPGLSTIVYPVVEITPNNGTLTGFTLTTNGEILSVVGNIASGDSVTVNSISAVVTTGANIDTENTGAYVPADLYMAGVTGKFPVLVPPGNNTMRFIRTGGTATDISVVTSYRKRYRR